MVKGGESVNGGAVKGGWGVDQSISGHFMSSFLHHLILPLSPQNRLAEQEEREQISWQDKMHHNLDDEW